MSRRVFSSILALALAATGYASKAAAQTYPAFPTPLYQPAVTLDQGISSFSVPNSIYGTALLSVYARSSGFGYSVSQDGQTSVYNNATTTGLPGVNCNAATPATCSAAITTFNGQIYIAYSDANNHGLDVAIATPIPSNVGYTFSLVHTDSSVQLVTAPAMTVSPNGQNLVIIFGTSNDPNTKNQFYRVNRDLSGNWTAANEGGNLQTLRLSSAAQPAMTSFNGQIWLCSQQNASAHQLFVYNTDATGQTWNFVENVPSLALGGGASMVVFNGNLVLANQQNNSNHALFVFSSPNGTSWSAQQYGSIQMGGTPGLALYSNGISLAFKGNNSSALYGSFATH